MDGEICIPFLIPSRLLHSVALFQSLWHPDGTAKDLKLKADLERTGDAIARHIDRDSGIRVSIQIDICVARSEMANNILGGLENDTIDSLRESDELAGRSKDLPIRGKGGSAEEAFESPGSSVDWNCSGSLSTGLIVDDCECDLVRVLASLETTWQGDRRGGEESERGDDGENHFGFEDAIEVDI